MKQTLKIRAQRRLSRGLARIAPRFFASKLHHPIFIIGSARSGTTVLTSLLARHHDVAEWSEANDILDPYGYPWHANQRDKLPLWLDYKPYVDRWWQDTESRQQEIKAIWGAYQFLKRNPYFVNKSPMNTLRIQHLLTMFPDAKFVHIVRDGRAVANSYTRKEIHKIDNNRAIFASVGAAFAFDDLAVKLADFWRATLEEVDQQDQALHLSESQRLMEVTYETLCNDRDTVLKEICAFIGLDFARFNPSINDIVLTNQNHKWKQNFSEDVQKQVVDALEPAFSERGYDHDAI